MKQISLFVVAALFTLISTAVAYAGQTMPAAQATSGMTTQEQKADSMGSKMEDTKMKDKKMEGKATKTEGEKGAMSTKMEGAKMEDKKMEGDAMKMEGKK